MIFCSFETTDGFNRTIERIQHLIELSSMCQHKFFLWFIVRSHISIAQYCVTERDCAIVSQHMRHQCEHHFTFSISNFENWDPIWINKCIIMTTACKWQTMSIGDGDYLFDEIPHILHGFHLPNPNDTFTCRRISIEPLRPYFGFSFIASELNE